MSDSNEIIAARIIIGDQAMSPAQYRWLFPDLLTAIPEGKDDAALTHYRRFGQREIALGDRSTEPLRLLAVRIQSLSPRHPTAAPSDWMRFHPDSDPGLDIYLSHQFPTGRFSPDVEQTGTRRTRLYIKAYKHDSYQGGIPGVTETIEETAEWLRRVHVLTGSGPLRTVGVSSGASGAIIYGHLLAADAVYAFSPEMRIGLPHARSYRWVEDKHFHPEFSDLRPLVQALGDRLIVAFGVYELAECHAALAFLDAGVRSIAFCASIHPVGELANLAGIARSTGAVVPLEDAIFGGYTDQYDRDVLRLAAEAHEAVFRRDFAAASALVGQAAARQPDNAGLQIHVGILQAITGDMAAARQIIQDAQDQIVAYFEKAALTHKLDFYLPMGPHGKRLAVLCRVLVRSEYADSLDAGQIAAIESLFRIAMP